jgi:hypothetical protein
MLRDARRAIGDARAIPRRSPPSFTHRDRSEKMRVGPIARATPNLEREARNVRHRCQAGTMRHILFPRAAARNRGSRASARRLLMLGT